MARLGWAVLLQEFWAMPQLHRAAFGQTWAPAGRTRLQCLLEQNPGDQPQQMALEIGAPLGKRFENPQGSSVVQTSPWHCAGSVHLLVLAGPFLGGSWIHRGRGFCWLYVLASARTWGWDKPTASSALLLNQAWASCLCDNLCPMLTSDPQPLQPRCEFTADGDVTPCILMSCWAVNAGHMTSCECSQPVKPDFKHGF